MATKKVELKGATITLDEYGDIPSVRWRPTEVVAEMHDVAVKKKGGHGSAPMAMALLHK